MLDAERALRDLIMVTAVPTPRGMGTTTAVLIGINMRLDKQDEISDRPVKHPAVRYIARTTGRYDVVIEAYFRDVDHLSAFIAKDLGSDPAVNHVETSLILRSRNSSTSGKSREPMISRCLV